jgi:hypothetical protein
MSFSIGPQLLPILSEIDFWSSAPSDLTDVVGPTSHLDFAESSNRCYAMISSASVVQMEFHAERVHYWSYVGFHLDEEPFDCLAKATEILTVKVALRVGFWHSCRLSRHSWYTKCSSSSNA